MSLMNNVASTLVVLSVLNRINSDSSESSSTHPRTNSNSVPQARHRRHDPVNEKNTRGQVKDPDHPEITMPYAGHWWVANNGLNTYIEDFFPLLLHKHASELRIYHECLVEENPYSKVAGERLAQLKSVLLGIEHTIEREERCIVEDNIKCQIEVVEGARKQELKEELKSTRMKSKAAAADQKKSEKESRKLERLRAKYQPGPSGYDGASDVVHDSSTLTSSSSRIVRSQDTEVAKPQEMIIVKLQQDCSALSSKPPGSSPIATGNPLRRYSQIMAEHNRKYLDSFGCVIKPLSRTRHTTDGATDNSEDCQGISPSEPTGYDGSVFSSHIGARENISGSSTALPNTTIDKVHATQQSNSMTELDVERMELERQAVSDLKSHRSLESKWNRKYRKELRRQQKQRHNDRTRTTCHRGMQADRIQSGASGTMNGETPEIIPLTEVRTSPALKSHFHTIDFWGAKAYHSNNYILTSAEPDFPPFYTHIYHPLSTRKRIQVFLGNEKGPVVAQAKCKAGRKGTGNMVTLDGWREARSNKRQPTWTHLKTDKRPGSMKKYTFSYPFGDDEKEISEQASAIRTFQWTRTKWWIWRPELAYELRELPPHKTEDAGEVLAMLSYKGGYGGLKFGKGKITIKKGIGRDVVRAGAARVPGWTDWDVMVMMTALCITEACKTKAKRYCYYRSGYGGSDYGGHSGGRYGGQ